MIGVGLTSVTFRKANPQQVIQLAQGAGLQSIEWGGDVHVPPEDIINAQKIGKMTRDVGLKIAGYGSYFAAGNQNPEAFKKVLQAAVARLPEFEYSNVVGKCKTLALSSDKWIFPANGSYGNVHFTPLWYPDGDYTVSITLSDMWTPAGMITRTVNTNTIKITDSAYDDWYVGR